MQVRRNIVLHIFCILLVVLLIVTACLCCPFCAFAETSLQTAYEDINVLDELENSTIGSELFDIHDYPADYSGDIDIQILSFVEFAYSYDVARQGDFGLYLLVYNPTEQVIDNNDVNSIQMSYANGSQSKYPLQIVNFSEDVGCEGRFYKFKIVLSVTERYLMLQSLDSSNRVYSVTGVELSYQGNVVDHKVAQTYTYTGFSYGYGSPHMTESTLVCKTNGFEKYVELNVQHTYYRAKGDFYDGAQSQINSCYFRVPNMYFENYGTLTKVLCEWYEYVTKPILVTETKAIYQNLYNLHGGSVNGFSNNNYFLVMCRGNSDSSLVGQQASSFGLASNCPTFDDHYYWMMAGPGLEDLFSNNFLSVPRFDNFAAVFYTGDNVSFEDKYVSSDELMNELLVNSAQLGAPYLAGRFSDKLFESYVEDGHTLGLNRKIVNADDDVDYFWNVTTKSFWQTVFGGYDVDTLWDSVKAIVVVDDEDLSGSNAEIASRLFVSEQDVDSIKEEYSLAQTNNERLVLMRFGCSTYYSMPCYDSFLPKAGNSDDDLVKDVLYKFAEGDRESGYIANETVYLNFDIISLFFNLNDVETEIPVVSSPTNAIAGISPPLEENYHNENTQRALRAILAIVLGVVIVVIILLIVFKLHSSLARVTVQVNTSDSNKTAVKPKKIKKSKK